MALGLGCALALGLAAGQGGIARLFTRDPAVLRSLALLMPAVVSEPVSEAAPQPSPVPPTLPRPSHVPCCSCRF